MQKKYASMMRNVALLFVIVFPIASWVWFSNAVVTHETVFDIRPIKLDGISYVLISPTPYSPHAHTHIVDVQIEDKSHSVVLRDISRMSDIFSPRPMHNRHPFLMRASVFKETPHIVLSTKGERKNLANVYVSETGEAEVVVQKLNNEEPTSEEGVKKREKGNILLKLIF